MVTIQLNEQEAELLHETLQGYFGELEMEIAHTDRREFKDYLKSKEALLRRLIRELKSSAAVAK